GWTLEEFRAVSTPPGLLRAERGMPTSKRQARAFEALDADRDGRLSPAEWARPEAPAGGWLGALRRLVFGR
ncbi:MAG: hypothetical protein VKS61_07645, partial [Candidatus Sericytochromatia bacterium]|nr:hypothetical protein [Candidatus Sericytochromatia bacterium]